MKVTPEIYNKIITKLVDAYPFSIEWDNLQDLADEDVLTANLYYIQQSGGIENALVLSLDNSFSLNCANLRATAKLISECLPQGGLSILQNSQTVRLHEDTLRALLESAISSSHAVPSAKLEFLKTLKELPAKSIEHLVKHLISKGLDLVSLQNLLNDIPPP